MLKNQHDFHIGKYIVTIILTFKAYTLESFNDKCQVDTVFTNLKKAFDTIGHTCLISELETLDVGNPLLF